jgi:hypothetical protein
MRPGGPRRRYHGALGLWLTLTALPAAAQVSPLSGQTLFYHQAANNYAGNHLVVDGGAIWTDNTLRTAGGSSDTLLLLGLSGDVSGEGGRFDYHLSSNLALLKYLSGSFPTRPTGFLDGRATLKIVPGFFSWIAREAYSQVQINLYTPVTPENLVSLNYITTGPRFTLRPTLRTSVLLDALYSYLNSSSVSSQFTTLDNHRYGGNLTIDRAFSEIASLYLKGKYEKVEFKDQVNNHNFSIGTAEGGYKLLDGRTVFDISGGYSQLRVYDVLGTVEGPGGTRETLSTEEFEEPVWKLQLSRLITPTQRLALTASQRFIDAATAFPLSFDQPVPTSAPGQLASGAASLQRHFGADWRIQGRRTSLSISLTKYTTHYLVKTAPNENDYNSKLANALLTRQLSPVLTWDIGVSYSRLNQIGTQIPGLTAQSATEYGAITNLQWQVGAHLGLRFVYAYSSFGGVATNQVGVIASWAVIGSQANTPQAFPVLAPISPASTMPR